MGIGGEFAFLFINLHRRSIFCREFSCSPFYLFRKTKQTCTKKMENQRCVQSQSQSVSAGPCLHAFDFDRTIIDLECDDVLTNAPGFPSSDTLDAWYKNTKNWQVSMNLLMKHLAMQGISMKEVEKQILTLEFLPGMANLLQKIHESCLTNPKSKFLIISDGNDYFINLVMNKLSPPVIPHALITNKGTICSPDTLDDNVKIPYLKIEPYGNQTHCTSCPSNLCKGSVLEKFIEENGPFEKVFYAGDGNNDVCAGRKLRENDVLFVRKGFELEKAVQTGMSRKTNAPVEFSSKIVIFENGVEIEKNMMF